MYGLRFAPCEKWSTEYSHHSNVRRTGFLRVDRFSIKHLDVTVGFITSSTRPGGVGGGLRAVGVIRLQRKNVILAVGKEMWYVCVCQRETIRLLHLDLFLSHATTLACRTRKDVRTYGLKSSQRRNKKKTDPFLGGARKKAKEA